MKYDFTKVQRLMAERGMTLEDLWHRTEDAVRLGSLARALKLGRAHQSTAKAISRATGIPIKDMLPATNGRK